MEALWPVGPCYQLGLEGQGEMGLDLALKRTSEVQGTTSEAEISVG